MRGRFKSTRIQPVRSPDVDAVRAGETADEREDLRLETRPTDPSFDDVMFSDVLSPTFSELEGHSRRLNDLLHLEFDASGKVLQPPGALTASPHQAPPVPLAGRFVSLDSPDSSGDDEGGDAGTHPALAAKLNKLIAKLGVYKRRCGALGQQREALGSKVKQLESDVARLEDELEVQASQNETSIMTRLGLDPNKLKARDGGAEGAERRRREDAKRQLFRVIDIVGEGEEGALADDTDLPRYKRMLKHAAILINKSLPLQNDLKSVEALFGPTVLAYFAFSNWIFLNFIIMALLSLLFLIRHILHGSYTITRLVDYYMPDVLMPSSYLPTEAGTFAFNTIVLNVAFLVLGLRKWIKEDMRVKAQRAFEGQSGKFSKTVLSLWDLSAHSIQEVEELKLANGQQLNVLMLEEETAELKAKRTASEKLKLLARRVSGILLSAALQALIGYVIVILTIESSIVQDKVQKSGTSFLAPFASSIVPAAVSLMNAVQPPVLTLIAQFEGWDESGSYIKWMVWRLFISKLLNVLIQVFSFVLLADPYLLQGKSYGMDTAFMKQVRQSATPPYQQAQFSCRADQVAASLLRLVLTDFVIGKLILIAWPVTNELYSKFRKEPVKKDEMDLPNKMASLLYYVSLCLAAMVWSPLLVFLFAPSMYLNFKFDKWVLFRFLQKPLRPWSARDAGIFFVKFYLITQVIGVLLSVVMLSDQTFPKSCSVMSGVINRVYSGVDPYCTALNASAAYINQTPSPISTSQQRLNLLGAEATYWFRVDCYGQCVATSGNPGASGCTDICTNVVNVTVGCNTQTASFVGTTFIAANITKPCDLACGPFVLYTNGWAALQSSLDSYSTFLYTLYTGVQTPAVLITLSVCLLMLACMKWNSLNVIEELSYQREVVLKQNNEQLARKLRVQAKRLALLQGVNAE